MYRVTLYVAMDDAEALHAEAVRRAKEDGLHQDSIDEMLGTKDNISISDCLRYVFDPGTSPPGTQIQDSSCESYGETLIERHGAGAS